MSKWQQHLATIRARIEAGRTPEQIALEFGITPANFYKICQRNGIAVPRPTTYKSRKLPPLEVMVEALQAAGYTVRAP